MKETVGETFYPGFRRSTAQFGVLAAFIVAVAVAATIRTVIRSVSATGLITATCFGLTGSLLVWTWSIRWVASMNLTYVQRQAAFEVFILAVTSGLLVVAAITAAAARYSSSHRNSEAETSAVSALEP